MPGRLSCCKGGFRAMRSSDAAAPDRLRILLAGIRKTGVSVLYQGPDLVYALAANVPSHWPDAESIIGQRDAMIFGEEASKRIVQTKRAVLESGEGARIEASVDNDGTRHWYSLAIEPDLASDGRVVGLFTTAIDIDDAKYREQVLKTLLREVSHRSKNLLAIIQSIATQTARGSDTVEAFLRAFRGRIHSLSSSQDLVTASDWRGAGFFDLANGQIEPYARSARDIIDVRGLDAHLYPNAALYLGLALHELAVDSATSGALATLEGRISLCASETKGVNGEDLLQIIWEEMAPFRGSQETAATPNRFSSTVLERIVPQALQAAHVYRVEAGHVYYRLLIPAGEYDC